MRGRASVGCAVIVGLLLMLVSGVSRAQDGPKLRAKAVELGVSGSVTSVEGVSTVAIGLRLGQYRNARGVVLQYSAGLAYYRVSDTDQLEIEGALAAFARISETSTYAFAGVAAAVRQEWTGSFSHDRYALGADLGLKVLASSAAAGTLTYQFRRVLNDPVADFNEHRLVIGISILFRNAADEKEED